MTVNAIISPAGRRILNVDKARRGDTCWLLCCWDDCERDGVDSNKARFHDHNPGIRCDDPTATHVWYVFCSERHRQMFLNAHRDGQGRLPLGEHGRIL